MLANNRFFGTTNSTRVSGLAPSGNGLLMFQVLARQAGGYGKTVSTPRGYGSIALAWPAQAGEFASEFDAGFALTASGTLIAAYPFTADASLVLGASGTLQAIAPVAGATSLALTATGAVSAVASVAGSASLTLSAIGSIGAIVPVIGSASISLSASATLGAYAAIAGTAYFSAAAEAATGELTAEGVAAAVWNALGTLYNEPGSMGNKLNTASTGGIDLDALALAIRDELAVELARIDVATSTRSAPGVLQSSDVKRMNNADVIGDGTTGNAWRGVGVPP